MSFNDFVINYYNECDFDYNWVWGTDKNHFIHYGFYDSENSTHEKALNNMARQLFLFGKILPNQKVLDAGCGTGGNAVFLAKEYGSQITAVNINQKHLNKTLEFAKKNKVDSKITCVLADFANTGLPDSSYDMIFALESSCYAVNKSLLFQEVFRLLKPGGKFLIADGFLKDPAKNLEQKLWIDSWLEGWAVPNLLTVEEYSKKMMEVGFNTIKSRDITEKILPSSLRLNRAYFWLYPIAMIFSWLGVRRDVHIKNMKAARAQYLALKNNLWSYNFLSAEKSFLS